jgi:hypothetical protein
MVDGPYLIRSHVQFPRGLGSHLPQGEAVVVEQSDFPRPKSEYPGPESTLARHSGTFFLASQPPLSATSTTFTAEECARHTIM